MTHDGWLIEEESEGGQPNGSGEIEPSDYREWFSSERETHHRRVITLTGPWEDGPTEGARVESKARADNLAAEVLRREESTLREAARILARRGATP